MLPRIIFDTSGINALEARGADSAPLMRRLAWRFDVILCATNLEELVSTASVEKRKALVRRFERLLRSGRCLVSPGEIVELMISSHVEAPAQFDWMQVDVRMPPGFDLMMKQRDHLDDGFCEEQRVEQQGTEKAFKQLLKSVRPALDEIPTQERPISFQEFLKIVEADGQFLWNFERGIYEMVSGESLAEQEIRDFARKCPPFHAICLGQSFGFYGWSLRGQRGRKDAAGRNDLMMAVYLPYCDQFITNDSPQREALRAVAQGAEISCQILSFDEFAEAPHEQSARPRGVVIGQKSGISLSCGIAYS